MAKKFIITTNLEKKFIKSVNSLYLGDWCLNANEIKKRTNIKSTDLENYNYYLGSLVQRLSVSLALFLNKQNKKIQQKFLAKLNLGMAIILCECLFL